MAIYYIDYDVGDDSNNGTSQLTPWKHCRGDQNASGLANSTTIQPGDSLLFKGGIHYRGSIRPATSGTPGNPITYNGNSWGTGKAIIDGSVRFTGTWTQCVNSGECYNNTGFANIWYADTLFSGQTSLNTVIINDEFLAFAQDIPPIRPIWFDIVTNWRTANISGMAIDSLIDSGYLTQSTTNFWTGAYIGVHKSPNEVSIQSITGYDPLTSKVSFVPLSNTSFYSPTPYSMIGHPYNMTENTYGVIGNRMWIWPSGGNNPNSLDISIGKLDGAFDITARQYLTFDNLKMVGYYGLTYTLGYGIYSSPGDSTHYSGVVVKNCDFKNMRSINKDPVLFMRQLNNCLVSGNTISNCLRSKGMMCVGTGMTTTNNDWSLIGGTTVYYAGVTSGLISNNSLFGIRGTHGNGISVYQGSSGVVVQNNYLSECGYPITYENSRDVYFYNNFVECSYGNVNEWGGMTGLVKWYNNTLVNSANHVALSIQPGASSVATYDVKNNFFDGMAWNTYPTDDPNVVHQYNIWLGRHLGYSPPTLGSGESLLTGLTNAQVIFVNPTLPSGSNWNYHLKTGSPAIGSGYNLSAYFTNDISGLSRTIPWDIGAYAYVSNSFYHLARLARYPRLKGYVLN